MKKGNKKNGGLGNALIKSKNKQKMRAVEIVKETGSEEITVNAKAKLASHLEGDALTDFLYKAEISQQKFIVSSKGPEKLLVGRSRTSQNCSNKSRSDRRGEH